jgi:hypothetical protein
MHPPLAWAGCPHPASFSLCGIAALGCAALHSLVLENKMARRAAERAEKRGQRASVLGVRCSVVGLRTRSSQRPLRRQPVHCGGGPALSAPEGTAPFFRPSVLPIFPSSTLPIFCPFVAALNSLGRSSQLEARGSQLPLPPWERLPEGPPSICSRGVGDADPLAEGVVGEAVGHKAGLGGVDAGDEVAAVVVEVRGLAAGDGAAGLVPAAVVGVVPAGTVLALGGGRVPVGAAGEGDRPDGQAGTPNTGPGRRWKVKRVDLTTVTPALKDWLSGHK